VSAKVQATHPVGLIEVREGPFQPLGAEPQ
jgi:hypothetical protein